MNIETVEAQRERILGQMRAVRNAHPGGVSEQMVGGTRKDTPETVERGPLLLPAVARAGKAPAAAAAGTAARP